MGIITNAGVAQARREEERDMDRPTAAKRNMVPPQVSAADAAAWTDRRASEKATRAADARKVSGRRRLVDPTTCDRDYSKAEMEFMQAMSEYKKSSGRMFPTWSEVLEVLRDLGYEKIAPV